MASFKFGILSPRHETRMNAFSVLFVFTSLAAALPALASDMDANPKALAKLDDDWSRAAVAKDVDRVVSFYAEDAIAYPPQEPAAIGKTGHVEVAKSCDLGYTTGTYEDSFTGPDGKLVSEKRKYMCTCKKQKDGTRMATQDMWNSDAK